MNPKSPGPFWRAASSRAFRRRFLWAPPRNPCSRRRRCCPTDCDPGRDGQTCWQLSALASWLSTTYKMVGFLRFGDDAFISHAARRSRELKMWLFHTIPLLMVIKGVLCRFPSLADRGSSNEAHNFGSVISSSKDVPFRWRNIESVFAFGDSYTFVQGTEGHTNFR